MAARGALAYHRMRGRLVWRRLVVIAFEDVGVADPDLLVSIVQQCLSADRRRCADEERAALQNVARKMALAPTDRSADYLLSAIKDHPEWEAHRITVARLPVAGRIQLAVDPSADLALRATATWFGSGVNGGGAPMVGQGDLRGLMEAFAAAGVPADLTQATERAVIHTKEPITLFIPLLWSVVRGPGIEPSVVEGEASSEPAGADFPLWVLDKHTAGGKRAIGEFARVNEPVRTALERVVPDYRARDVALMAAFYADAITTDQQLIWNGSEALYRDGMEADMLTAHCPRDAAAGIIEIVRANLHHLNAIRARMASASFWPNHHGVEFGETR